MGTHPIFESDFDCLTEKMGKVYVGKLGAEPLDESDLEEEFEEYGSIKSIFVARNPPGFAYVEFYKKRDVDAKGSRLNWPEVDAERKKGRGASVPKHIENMDHGHPPPEESQGQDRGHRRKQSRLNRISQN